MSVEIIHHSVVIEEFTGLLSTKGYNRASLIYEPNLQMNQRYIPDCLVIDPETGLRLGVIEIVSSGSDVSESKILQLKTMAKLLNVERCFLVNMQKHEFYENAITNETKYPLDDFPSFKALVQFKKESIVNKILEKKNIHHWILVGQSVILGCAGIALALYDYFFSQSLNRNQIIMLGIALSVTFLPYIDSIRIGDKEIKLRRDVFSDGKK